MGEYDESFKALRSTDSHPRARTPFTKWEVRKQLFPRQALDIAGPEVQDKMINLYRSLQAMLPFEQGKIVQLLELYPHQGGAALTREMAKIVAFKFHKKVLLLDATPQAQLLSGFGVFPNYSWVKAYRDHKAIGEALYQLADSSLFVSQISREAEAITEVIESPLTDQYFEELRHVFDLVFIDAVPATVSVDGLALASKADGAVLIIEAEKTRWQVAKKVKDDLETQGGRVIGTILSNKRHYIPQFLYDRL